MDLHHGTVVSQYTIEAILGRGGMATVYLVRHNQLGTRCALKVLTTPSPRIRARLLQEGRAQGALRHPNVVNVTDTVDLGHSLGLVMEYVEGPTLHSLLLKHTLTLNQADELARGIIAGVAAAHAQGLIHRDLKPQNILLAVTEQGLLPKIADFGLAKALDEDDGGGGVMTRSGVGMGTPPYMAPEQIRDAKSADQRADIFSLGAILYELVTRHRAFHGGDMFEMFVKINSGDYRPPRQLLPDLPVRMEKAIVGALLVDKDERIQDCMALLSIWTGLDPTEQEITWGSELLIQAKDWTGEIKAPGAEISADLTFSTSILDHSEDSAPPATGVQIQRSGRQALWMGFGAVLTALVGAAVIFGPTLLGTGEVEEAVHYNPTFEQLTWESDKLLHPTLAPDGRTVVYERRGELYSRRVDGMRPILLTEDFTKQAFTPAFSPDGERLAFAADDGLYVMGAMGESPVRLADHGFHPSWSPSGESLAFVTSYTGDPTSPGETSKLEILKVSGVPQVVDAPHDIRGASWSPDGHRLAYWTADHDIYTISVAGGEPVDALVSAAAEWHPTWSPDGTSLRYLSDRSGAVNLWEVQIDATGSASKPRPLTSAPMGGVWSFGASADGNRFVYNIVYAPATLMKAVLDPTAGSVVSGPDPVLAGDRAYVAPSISPDGSMLAFDLRGSQEDLYVAGADGKGLQQLTDDSAWDRTPDFSPDGGTILFSSNRGDSGISQIWSVAIDGSALRQVTSEAADLASPEWSSDGETFVARGADGLVRFDLDGHELGGVEEPAEDRSCRWPREAPDGDHYVCVGDDQIRWGSRTDGTLEALIDIDPGARFSGSDPLALSADGKTIAYGVAWETSNLWVVSFEPVEREVDAAGVSFQRLTHEPSIQQRPAISPDGNQVVFEQDGGLSLRRVGGDRVVSIAKDGLQPAFSADGDKLAWATSRGIYAAGAMGENARKVIPIGYHPSWSPDGQRIVYSESFAPRWSEYTKLGPIKIASLDGSAPTVVVFEGLGPDWSPNGHRIAYWTQERDIRTVAPDGTGSTLVPALAGAKAWSPRWSPSGHHLYFVSDRSGTTDIWRVAIDEESGVVVGEPIPVTSGMDGEISDIEIAGNRLVFSAERTRSNLYRYELDGETRRVVGAGRALTQGSNQFIDPSLSPDGSQVAFASLGVREHLFVANVDGSGFRKLLADEYHNRKPAWSPDEGRIAFHSDRSGRYDVWTIRPDGGELENRTSEASVQTYTPAWGPNGVLATAAPGNSDPLFFPSDGDPYKPAGLQFVPHWSPNGERVIGRLHDRMISVADASDWAIVRAWDVGFVPRWIDDDALLYRGRAGTLIWQMADEDRGTTVLRAPAGETIQSFDVSLDGKTLIIGRGSTATTIWVADLAEDTASN